MSEWILCDESGFSVGAMHFIVGAESGLPSLSEGNGLYCGISNLRNLRNLRIVTR